MLRTLLGTLAAIATVSCATPYRAGSMDGFLCGGTAGELLCGGVNASPLGGDAYRIEASLNRYSSQSRLQDYLLLRAAELSLENGAVGFVIDGARDTSREGVVITGGMSSTTGFVHGSGNTAMVSATTTYQPWQASSFIRPGGMMIITIVRAPVPPGVRYFDASEVMAAIGSRVRRDDAAPSVTPSITPSITPSTTPSTIAIGSMPIDPRSVASSQAQSSTEMRTPQATLVSRVAFSAARCADVEAAWNDARQRGDSRTARLEEDIWSTECSAPSR